MGYTVLSAPKGLAIQFGHCLQVHAFLHPSLKKAEVDED